MDGEKTGWLVVEPKISWECQSSLVTAHACEGGCSWCEDVSESITRRIAAEAKHSRFLASLADYRSFVGLTVGIAVLSNEAECGDGRQEIAVYWCMHAQQDEETAHRPRLPFLFWFEHTHPLVLMDLLDVDDAARCCGAYTCEPRMGELARKFVLQQKSGCCVATYIHHAHALTPYTPRWE